MDLEKRIKAQIKDASKLLTLDNHTIKANNHGGRILLDRTLVGGFDFIFSKGKFIDYGAILGVNFGAYIFNSPIDNIIKKLNLSFPRSKDILNDNFYLWINSFDYKRDYFFKGGKLMFYPNDDIEKKVEEMMNKIQNLYFSKINNYINILPDLSKDVLEYSTNYAYPLASIVISKFLNNNIEDLEETIEIAKSKKLYDAKSSLIDEIKEKVDHYFDNISHSN